MRRAAPRCGSLLLGARGRIQLVIQLFGIAALGLFVRETLGP